MITTLYVLMLLGMPVIGFDNEDDCISYREELLSASPSFEKVISCDNISLKSGAKY